MNGREPIPFDLNRPRRLLRPRIWSYGSGEKDGDVLDMHTGKVLKMGGFSITKGGQRFSEPSGAKFNFNRFGPQIPDPEG